MAVSGAIRVNPTAMPFLPSDPSLMKTTLAIMASIAMASMAFGDEVAKTTTATTATVGDGTITEYTPGTRFVVKESSGPVQYRYGEKVEYYRSGKVLTEDQVREHIRVGRKVHVHYRGEGSDRVIHRVEIDE